MCSPRSSEASPSFDGFDKGNLILKERIDGFAHDFFGIPASALSELRELRLFFGC